MKKGYGVHVFLKICDGTPGRIIRKGDRDTAAKDQSNGFVNVFQQTFYHPILS